jgi:hypothetical protein
VPTRLEIIDAALERMGEEPLGDEAAPGAATHLKVWSGVTGYILAANPWSFNTVTRKLTRLTDPPELFYAYQFTLPHDMLGAPRAIYDRADCKTPYTRWEILDEVLLADAAELWLKMDKQPNPARWPGYFAELVTLALMSEFALSIREDPVLRERLRGDCYGTPSEGGTGGLMGQAMTLDSQGKPSTRIQLGSDPFTSSRRGW